MSETILETRGLTKYFGTLLVIDHVDFSLKRNEIVGLIGPNGAGKTTFFNLITGFHKPSSGKIIFEGKDLTNLSPDKRVELGIGRTFQLVAVFDDLTVIENITLSILKANSRKKSLHNMFSPAINENTLEKTFQILKLLNMEKFANVQASELSYGNKRKLELGIALALNPKLLLLDEPFSGLSDAEISEILEVIRRVSRDRTLIIVEHKVSKIIQLVERLVIMHEGRIVADGNPKEAIESEVARKIYWKV